MLDNISLLSLQLHNFLMIETSSDVLRSSSAIDNNNDYELYLTREHLRQSVLPGVPEIYGNLRKIFGNWSEIFGKSSKRRHHHVYIYVWIYENRVKN